MREPRPHTIVHTAGPRTPRFSSRTKVKSPASVTSAMPAKAVASGNSPKKSAPRISAQTIWLYCAGAMRFAGAARVAAIKSMWPVPPQRPATAISRKSVGAGMWKSVSMIAPLTVSDARKTTPISVMRFSVGPSARSTSTVVAPQSAIPTAVT